MTGGADNNVCVIDIGTGTVLQTLRGHTHQVVALAFDSERIISASRDSTLRYWKWGEKRHAPADKYHVLDKGDTLPFVARNYEISLQDLMKWNGVREVRDTYPGMRLIVRKADPTQLTKAELAEFDKERKRLKGQAKTDAKIKQIQMDRGSLFARHSRVYKLATDIDPYSLGNRMFKKQKLDSELYPEKDDLYDDRQSLGSRLKHNTGKGLEFNPLGARFFPSKANEDEWGLISDQLGNAMLETFIEFMAYELVKDEKRKIRDSLSVLGRMQMSPGTKAENTRLLVKKGRGEKLAGRALPPIEWKSSFEEPRPKAKPDADEDEGGSKKGDDEEEEEGPFPREAEEGEGEEGDYGLVGYGARSISSEEKERGMTAGNGSSVGSSSALNMEEEDSDFLSLMKNSVVGAADGADY